MSSSDENQDLNAYFDSFKGEIDESNNCVTLTAEALRALSEADAVTEKILEEDAGTTTDEYKSTDLLKHLNGGGKKGIYYLKLSDQESIQVKLIDESSRKHEEEEEEDLAEVQEKEADNENNEAAADEESPREAECKRGEVYEFDENELRPSTDADDVDDNVCGSVLHIVPGTSNNSDGQMHQCTKCSYTTSKKFLLSRHLHTHSDDRPYKCSVCDRSFKVSTALITHMNLHLGKKPHGCSYCDKRFNTSGEMIRHVRYKHTGEKPHKCGECDYSSVELSKLRRHMRCHTGERPYQCPHCTYASPDTFKLKRHLRTHTGEKPYECDICLARFTQSNSLKAHRLIHTVGERPSFQCSYCPTTCGRKTDLQLHMHKLHNPDNPVTCKRCGKQLPDRYTYKIHVKTHEGEKCFRCTLCPHASISQRLLDMHMLVHTDEKPFACEECGARFRQLQLLLRHVNYYHNEEYVPPTPSVKSHICPHCNRAFTRKGNLMRHMETHDSKINKVEEKLKLRMGRKIRIQADGTVSVPDNDDVLKCVISKNAHQEQCDENFAILEIDDDNVENDIDMTTITETKQESIECEEIYVKSEKEGEAEEEEDEDEESKRFMVIEVIDGDAGSSSILEIPIETGPKNVNVNAIGFSNFNEFIIDNDYKPSEITIMDVIDDD